jgi:hypothetical protein
MCQNKKTVKEKSRCLGSVFNRLPVEFVGLAQGGFGTKDDFDGFGDIDSRHRKDLGLAFVDPELPAISSYDNEAKKKKGSVGVSEWVVLCLTTNSVQKAIFMTPHHGRTDNGGFRVDFTKHLFTFCLSNEDHQHWLCHDPPFVSLPWFARIWRESLQTHSKQTLGRIETHRLP